MKILKVESKDIYVTIELSVAQIKHILDFLNHCICNYNSEEEPSMKESDAYMNETFFKELNDLYENIERGGIE